MKGKVKIQGSYLAELEKAETVFDMVAICYDMLIRKLDNPIVFISKYMDEYTAVNNPNIELLKKFSDEMADLLENYSKSTFQNKKQIIIDKMQHMELLTFGQKKENILSVIFSLLSVIDSMVPMWNLFDMRDHQPLNKGDSLKKYIVFPAKEGIHEDLIRVIGRERKTTSGIDENLNNIIVLDRSKLPKKSEVPKLNYLERRSQNRETIRLAMIVGIDGKHFTAEPIIGSAEKITYIEDLQGMMGEMICQKMHKAIEDGAEFVILPEFCASPQILTMIKSRLKEWKKDKTVHTDLIAVFPGSTWTDENDNVQFLLDAEGRNLGSYYKTTPFRKKKENVGYTITEALAHPGYRSTFLYVNGLGYVLPATCRDVIDGTYTDYYVKKFTPTLLIVPAWSSSGRSFEKPLTRYAADHFTNSVFCNGCGALVRQSTVLGGAAVLGKKVTVTAGVYESVKRPPNCTKPCNRMCTYMLEMKLSPTNAGVQGRISQSVI